MKELFAKLALLAVLGLSMAGAVKASAAEGETCCAEGAACCKPAAPCCK